LVDLSLRERLVMVLLVVSIIWLGLFPQPVLNTSQPAVKTIIERPENARAATVPQSTPVQSVINKPALSNHE
jgi:NADH-quinone oxidoreductase subunit M